MSHNNLPSIIFCSYPAAGHTHPLLKICKYLVSKGFPCFFLTGDEFHDQITAAGAEHHSVPWLLKPELFIDFEKVPIGPQRLAYGNKPVFVDVAPEYAKRLSTLMTSLREDDPDRKVVIIQENYFMGVIPFLLGVPPPKGYSEFPKVISIHTPAMNWEGEDTAPFGLNIIPGSPGSSVEENRRLQKQYAPYWQETADYADKVFKNMGSTVTFKHHFSNTILDTGDMTFMPCSASLEYPRSDLSAKVRYIGGLPRNKSDGNDGGKKPEWLIELEANASLVPAERKKVVFISQGTFIVDYADLLEPTLHALAERKDILIVATLGRAGAEVDLSVPANTKIVDYVPYDLVLPFTDIFIMNAGYGGFMHGIMNGVPMVLAGLFPDKGEVANRAEWAGVALNLRTQRPSSEQILIAVDEILANDSYKSRAVELRTENEAMDPLGTIEKTVIEFAR